MPEALTQGLATPGLIWLLFTIGLAGIVRGFSGFGTALIFVPVANIFLEPKILYRANVMDVPVDDYELPLGKAEVVAMCTLPRGRAIVLACAKRGRRSAPVPTSDITDTRRRVSMAAAVRISRGVGALCRSWSARNKQTSRNLRRHTWHIRCIHFFACQRAHILTQSTHTDHDTVSCSLLPRGRLSRQQNTHAGGHGMRG